VNETDQKPKPDRFGKRRGLLDSPRRQTAQFLSTAFIFDELTIAEVNTA
jgi:hypothetical protein